MLADHLLEHHEPLGELIQLQLSRAAGRRGTLERERQLFETYKHALWPDHPVGIAQTHLKFSDVERGFPSYFGARGELDVQLHDRLAKHPGWSTIETYRSWPEVSLAEMLPDAMPSLKKLLDVSLELLDAVRARAWPVEELSLTSDQGKTRPVTGLKQLRKLSVGSDHGLETAIENLGPSSLLHQVTHLEVFTPHASMATILEALSKLPRQLSSLYSAGITLTRGRKGIEAQLHAESSTLDDRLRQLEAIPARALASVHLVLDTNGFFTPKTRPVAEAASRLEAHVGAPSVVSLRPRDTHLVILTDR